MMIDLVAKRICFYGGRRYGPGHRFRVPKVNARALVAAGYAEVAKPEQIEEEKPKRSKRKYDTRHMTADSE